MKQEATNTQTAISPVDESARKNPLTCHIFSMNAQRGHTHWQPPLHPCHCVCLWLVVAGLSTFVTLLTFSEKQTWVWLGRVWVLQSWSECERSAHLLSLPLVDLTLSWYSLFSFLYPLQTHSMFYPRARNPVHMRIQKMLHFWSITAQFWHVVKWRKYITFIDSFLGTQARNLNQCWEKVTRYCL